MGLSLHTWSPFAFQQRIVGEREGERRDRRKKTAEEETLGGMIEQGQAMIEQGLARVFG